MTREEYRAQVDAVSFSPDFQARTMVRLEELAREREKKTVKKGNFRTGLVAAATVAALCVTAYAAVTLLRPRDVARQVGNEALADAFESEGAITVNETKTVGDYEVTLMGLVNGEKLSGSKDLGRVEADRTAAVLAMVPKNPSLSGNYDENYAPLTVSPLVEGYAPWQVNAWTLGASISSFEEDGVIYWVFDCDNVEPFADHTVYLAVYPGTHIPPSAELFDFDEGTGAITAKGEAALFVLPLDEEDPNDPGQAVITEK